MSLRIMICQVVDLLDIPEHEEPEVEAGQGRTCSDSNDDC